MNLQPQTRRRFLRLLAWCGGLTLLPGLTRSNDTGLRQAIDTLTGGVTPRFHFGVGLRMPTRAVSRMAVPIKVDCRLHRVDMIALLVSGNPDPLTARFNLAPQMRPYLRTHLRILQDSEVIALVRANGHYFRQSAKIRVSEGCS